MKRRMITAMIFSTLLAVSLTGCGTDDSSSTAAATTGTAAATESSTSTEDKQTDTTAEIKTTTAETTASEAPTAETTAVSSVLSDEQMKEASMELIQKYVNIYDGIFCGCVEYDENDCISPDSMRYYYRVTDPKYQSISDLKAELGTTLSGTEYDNMVSLMFEQEPQIYLEQEGKLYALSVGRGSAYSDTVMTQDGFRICGATETVLS